MLEGYEKREVVERVVDRIIVHMVDVAPRRDTAMVALIHHAMKSHALALEVATAPIIPDAIKLLDGVRHHNWRPCSRSALCHVPSPVRN